MDIKHLKGNLIKILADVNYASSNELDLCHKMGRLVRELHFGEFTHITWLCEEDQLNECNCYNCPLGNFSDNWLKDLFNEAKLSENYNYINGFSKNIG